MKYKLAMDEDGKVFYEAVFEAGQPCPACGRKVPMTGAERQRRYVARKKAFHKKWPGLKPR